MKKPTLSNSLNFFNSSNQSSISADKSNIGSKTQPIISLKSKINKLKVEVKGQLKNPKTLKVGVIDLTTANIARNASMSQQSTTHRAVKMNIT